MARWFAAAALAAGLFLATVVGVQPAQAATGDAGHVSASTTMFGCQDSRCPSVQSVPSGASVTTYCWRDGNAYAGSSRWFRVAYRGVRGWVSTGTISSPQPSVPYCSDMSP